MNQESLFVICALAVVCLALMLWLYFSNAEPVVLLSGDAPAPADNGLYQVQIKDLYVEQERQFRSLYTGTAESCQILRKDLLKRGYSVSDVRVVQIVA